MIVFIDDERRRMTSYAEELELALKQEVHFETDVDSALNFLTTQTKQVNLIIIDMMMSPGIRFKDENTEYGLRTGLLLYKEIRSQKQNVPIVIFTNANTLDTNLAKEIKTDNSCLLLQKEDFLPSEFAEELNRFLRSHSHPPK